MKFFRCTYDATAGRHIIGAQIKAIAWSMSQGVTQNRQGNAVAYDGKFSSTEDLRRGALVACHDNGVFRYFVVDAPAMGMSAIKTYRLTEDGGR